MEDRIFDLKGIPEKQIIRGGFSWYLGQEYVIPEAIMVKPYEVDSLTRVAGMMYESFQTAVDQIIGKAAWDTFDLPIAMREMIIDSWSKKHMHLIGRMDIAGGLENINAKVLEFNADTPTMLPESVYFQDYFREEFYNSKWVLFNRMHIELVQSFKTLLHENPDKDATLLVCSLGYEEDKLNAEVIRLAAEEAGFRADYADLEYVLFEPDGVYLEFEDGSDQRYDFMYKLVPWEFIMLEEPELLDILRNMQINNLLYILNPAYSILMQNKTMMAYMSKHFPADYVLKTSLDKKDFANQAMVEKVAYGRLGENIRIFDSSAQIVEEKDGDWGDFRKVYQAFTQLNRDGDFEYYQPGIYLVDGVPCGMSFRRGEDLIIDDDAEFIPHFILQ